MATSTKEAPPQKLKTSASSQKVPKKKSARAGSGSAPARNVSFSADDDDEQSVEMSQPASTSDDTGSNIRFIKSLEFNFDLTSVNKVKGWMENLQFEDLPKKLNEASRLVALHEGHSKKHSLMTLVYAWGCGKMLLFAKDYLKGKQGAFGDWRKEKFESPGKITEKTCQRYMKLAKEWETIDSLLEDAESLSGAYRTCGLLPPDPEVPKGKTDRSDYTVDDFVSKLSVIQQAVNRVSAILQKLKEGKPKLKLQKSQTEHFKLVRIQVEEFFKKITEAIA